jgi:hypothetical protein
MGGMSHQLLQEAAELLTGVQVKLTLLGTSLTEQETLARAIQQMDVVCDAYFRTVTGDGDPLTLSERQKVRGIVGRWLGFRNGKVPKSWQKLDPDHVLVGWKVSKRRNSTEWEATRGPVHSVRADNFDQLVDRVQEINEK